MSSPDSTSRGFTLVELLLAMALGLLVSGVAVQLLLGEARSSGALARQLQLRGWQRRTLALVRDDLDRSASWSIRPEPTAAWPCAWRVGNHSSPFTPAMATNPCCIPSAMPLQRSGAARC